MTDEAQANARNAQFAQGAFAGGSMGGGGGGGGGAAPTPPPTGLLDPAIGLISYAGDASNPRLLSSIVKDNLKATLFMDYNVGGTGFYRYSIKNNLMPTNTVLNTNFTTAAFETLAQTGFNVGVAPIVGFDDGNKSFLGYFGMGIGETDVEADKMLFFSGSYAGDGASNRVIAPGLPPGAEIVQIHIFGVGTNGTEVWKNPGLPGNEFPDPQQTQPGTAVTLQATTFTVNVAPINGAGNINEVGTTWYWMAFCKKGSATDDSARIVQCAVGTYVGDGTGSLLVPSGLTVPPKCLFLVSRAGGYRGFKSVPMGGANIADESFSAVFGGDVTFSGNDFTVGTGAPQNPNDSGVTYTFIALG